jgi:hypothetical protein
MGTGGHDRLRGIAGQCRNLAPSRQHLRGRVRVRVSPPDACGVPVKDHATRNTVRALPRSVSRPAPMAADAVALVRAGSALRW